MFWIGMIIGIFVMQLATFITCFVTQEKEDIVIPFSVFIFYPIVCLVNKIIRTIKHKRWVKRQLEKLNNGNNQLTHQHEDKGE